MNGLRSVRTYSNASSRPAIESSRLSPSTTRDGMPNAAARDVTEGMACCESYGVEMPIATDVYRVLTGNSDARAAYRGLLRVQAGAESEPG